MCGILVEESAQRPASTGKCRIADARRRVSPACGIMRPQVELPRCTYGRRGGMRGRWRREGIRDADCWPAHAATL
eukprot:3512466-Pyramimonas_sp.AAC.1